MIEYLLLLVGFVILIKGAHYFIEGSSYLAKRIGVSPLIIGLTVVAFGTSLPEFIINIFSAINGSNDLALGNIIGSNISNTLLILGISSLYYPLLIKKSIVWREIPWALFASLLLLFLVNDSLFGYTSQISSIDGLILLGVFCYFLYSMYNSSKKDKKLNLEIRKHNDFVISLMILGGLVGLFFGGNLIVKTALEIAKTFGISEFLISSTVIALGSSLPELVVSLTAIFKKNIDLAVGNIIGSNIFNILYVLGATSLVKPIIFSSFINFDIIFLILITCLLFISMFNSEKHILERKEGLLFLVLYVIYLFIILLRG